MQPSGRNVTAGGHAGLTFEEVHQVVRAHIEPLGHGRNRQVSGKIIFEVVDDMGDFFVLLFFLYKADFLRFHSHPKMDEEFRKQGLLQDVPFRARIRPGSPQTAGYVVQAVRFLGLAEDGRGGVGK